jgi:hypothetical protein
MILVNVQFMLYITKYFQIKWGNKWGNAIITTNDNYM